MCARYVDSEEDRKLRAWFQNEMTRALLRSISLELGSLRGLTPFRMAIEYPITAIAGRNGVGKSTLLAMACCAYHNFPDGFKLKRRKHAYYTFSDFFVQHSEEVPPQGILIDYEIAYDKWRPHKKLPGGKGIARQSRWKRIGGKWNDYAGRVRSNVVFLGIDRIVPHSERSQSRSYSKAFRDATPRGWEGAVAGSVGRILGKTYDKLRYLEHSKYDLPIVECNGVKYSGLNMGAGENALFEIFRIIYSCGEGALLVVDEIELGLHVEAQRRLVRELKSACLKQKIQIICTTHSVEIFGCLPPDGRKYVEHINGMTSIEDGIAPEFAMNKMGAHEMTELDVMVEDGVAEEILTYAIPGELRRRVRLLRVGSAQALSRQLAAAYARKEKRLILAVFDGDQRAHEAENLRHASNMAERSDSDFGDWFKKRIAYLPGEQRPELWLIQSNRDLVAGLASKMSMNSGLVANAIEVGLNASSHSEFVEIAKCTAMDTQKCVQAFSMNIAENKPEEFLAINTAIEQALSPGRLS